MPRRNRRPKKNRHPVHYRSETGERSVLLSVTTSEGFDAFLRVAAASGLVPGPRSNPDKQEAPGVGAPEGLTDRDSAQESNGGCSPERKR